MAKGTEATQKKYSEMTAAEKQAYKAELQNQLAENVKKIDELLPDGMKLTAEQKKNIREKAVTDERIMRHERAKFSGLTNVKEMTKNKDEIYAKYVPSGAIPFELKRIKSFLIKREDGLPENAEYNKRLFTGINKDDAQGLEVRRNLQLQIYDNVANLEIKRFAEKEECTFENFFEYGMNNFEDCKLATDMQYIIGGLQHTVSDNAKKRLDSYRNVGSTFGGVCVNAVTMAAQDEYLAFPGEFMNQDQLGILAQNFEKLGYKDTSFLNECSMYILNSGETSSVVSEVLEKYPNGIRIGGDEISKEPKDPVLGGYFPRKEGLLTYCREVRKLEDSNLRPLQEKCREVEELLSSKVVLDDDDVKNMVKLFTEHSTLYQNALSTISPVSLQNRNRVKELRATFDKGTTTACMRSGYLKELADDARKELQRQQEQKQDLMEKLRDPDTFAKYKEKIADITQDLKSTDDFYVWTNTKKFNEMRDATYALNKRMQAVKEGGIPSEGRLEEMADMLMQVSKKADAYATAKLESIKNEMREPENSPKQRSIHRLASAMNLKRLVAEGETHPIGKDNFKEQVGVLLNDVNERFHRYDANQPVQHDDKKTRADVEKFAVALERYIDKHPKILDNGLLAQDKVNKLKANIQSGKQKEMENPNLGAKTRSTGGLNI